MLSVKRLERIFGCPCGWRGRHGQCAAFRPRTCDLSPGDRRTWRATTGLASSRSAGTHGGVRLRRGPPRPFTLSVAGPARILHEIGPARSVWRTPRSRCACTPMSSATSSPRPPTSSPAPQRPPPKVPLLARVLAKEPLPEAERGSDLGALGGTRTPSLLIRRSMESVRAVRQNPNPQVSVLLDVRHRRPSPAPSGQSVRKL